jgi:murein DD-endopeptidase MepM/ murein hydrolase activator NlpD
VTTDTSWYGQQTLLHPDYDYPQYQQHYAYEYGYAPCYAYEGHGYAGYGYEQDHAGQQQAYYDAYQQPQQPYQPDWYTGEQPVHTPWHPVQSYETVPDLYVSHESYPPEPAPTYHETAVEPGADHFEAAYHEAHAETGAELDFEPGDDEPEAELDEPFEACASARGARRKTRRRRSAVLTIAVPSIAVLGVAGAAAATMGPRLNHTAAAATPATDATAAKAQALAAAEAKDAAERASRDKARTALQLRNAAAKKAAAEAPRFVLPIAYHTGLSALFGQAGTHWMQLHTGIDFPVPVGTPVHAVTAGTVATEWNPFYGYMVKLTAPDGTVTWYCHLSAYRVRSGSVKVGDVIAYSGDTGNSTGPHLHFEVHPNGGDAVDPLPWLLARGLDPR